MKTSESIASIAKALAAAQGEIRNPPCDKLVTVVHKSGGKHSFKYAQLPTCYDVTRAALSKNGICHFTAQIEIEGGIQISCRLVHSSGEWFESSLPLPHQADPKLMAGSLTYYRRYLFNGLVGIAGDDDLDDDQASQQGDREGHKPPPKGMSLPKPKTTVTEPGDFIIKLGSLTGTAVRECDIGALEKAKMFLESQAPGKLTEYERATLAAIRMHLEDIGGRQ
jgi:hypothetical protein